MTNEDPQQQHPWDRWLALAAHAADVLILVLLGIVLVRQQQIARDQADELRLAEELRRLRALAAQADHAPPTGYPELSVSIERVSGDEVRRATVQVGPGEPPERWIQKLMQAARGLEELK